MAYGIEDLVRIDRDISCCSIETECWLESVLGNEIDLDTEDATLRDWNGWTSDEKPLEAYIQKHYGAGFRFRHCDNVYNYEQSFYDVFQFSVFTKDDDSPEDWVWAGDPIVAVEVHCGGDVRGNYGRVRLYRPAEAFGGCNSLAESGFMDWVIGWYLAYLDGTPADEDGRYRSGYAANPTYELEKAADTVEGYGHPQPAIFPSDKGPYYLVRLNGRTARAFPDVRIGG